MKDDTCQTCELGVTRTLVVTYPDRRDPETGDQQTDEFEICSDKCRDKIIKRIKETKADEEKENA